MSKVPLILLFPELPVNLNVDVPVSKIGLADDEESGTWKVPINVPLASGINLTLVTLALAPELLPLSIIPVEI